MGTLINQSQMGDLENGLKDLRRSRLMNVQEFKDMYNAIDRHHRDLKLAHLTGKAKDILVQVQQDARFYHILIKMMSEVKQLKTAQQRESLKQVYTWFKLNRHTLHSGPHFGKVHHKKEAEDILKSCTTPRTNNLTPKTTKSSKTDGNKSKDDQIRNTLATVRLSSAGSSAKRFFQSDSPASKMTGGDSFTPRDPFATEIPSSKDYVSDYLFSNFMPQSAGKMDFTTDDFVSPYADGPEPELQRLDSSFGEVDTKISGGPSPPNTSPREDGGSVVSARYIDSLVNESRADINEDDDDIDLTTKADCDDNEFSEMRRKLSRPQTESPSLRGAISNQASSISIAMPKKMIHPIASLVNPHAQLAAMEAQRAEEEYLSAREKASSSARASAVHPGPSQMSFYRPVTRPSTVMGSRVDNLHAWKNFSKDMSYGQDILSKLNFVGRSGTAMDVRYTAHDNADMPEDKTAKVLTFYSNSQTEPPLAVLTPAEVEKENMLLQPSLEEFYQLTDGYYPHKIPKYKPVSKPRSAPPKRSYEPQEKHKKVEHKPVQTKAAPLGKNLLQPGIKQVVGSQAEERMKEVKLDAVYGMIDMVSDEMTAYKEKLAPHPQPGFRQPASTGVSMRPLSRPTTATGHRSPSPIQRANTPTPHPDAVLSRTQNAKITDTKSSSTGQEMGSNRPQTAGTRPISASTRPLSGREILMPTSDLPEEMPKSLHPSDNDVVDWRGKVTPDSSRYKWQKTKFGSHTYIKKMPSSKRPVGATHAGKRPRTAPLPVRDRWNTENPSDMNVRAPSQAATHNTKLVDQKAVDNMMVIQHLVGSSDSRAGSMQSLFLDENRIFERNEFLRSFSTRHTPIGGSTMTATPVSMEYLSFVSNAPKSVIDSRSQSRLTRRSDRTESRVEEFPVDDLIEKALSPSQQTAASPAGPFDIPPSPRTVTDHLSCDIPATEQKPSTDSDKADIADTETVQSTVHTDEQGEKSEEKVSDDQNVSEQNIEELEEDLVSRTPRTIDVIQEEESEEGSVRDQTPVNDHSQAPTTRVYPEGLRHPHQYYEDLNNGDVHIEVTEIPSTGRPPTPPTDRSVPLQELSKSDIWNFTPDVGNQDSETEEDEEEQEEQEVENKENTKKRNPYLYHRGEHWTKAIIKPENYCFGCLPNSMSTKVGRSAGRMPGRSQSASSQVLRMAKKQNEYFSRAPPLRTPPSIPSPYHQTYGRSPRYGETYNSELERHARTVKSPRHFMEHVGDLRKEIRSAPTGSYIGSDDLVSSTLHVCKLDLPSRSNTELDFNQSSNRDEMPFTLPHENTLYSDKIMEEGDQSSRPTSGKRVGWFDVDSDNVVTNSDTVVTNGDTVETSNITNGDVISSTEVQSSERTPGDETGNQGMSGETTTSHSTKQTSIAHIGRPIPQVSNIHDPEEEAVAAQIQREAKAAVDIQRIFRGYVARSNYKKLIGSERYKMEDERKAALEQQRQHKAHVERTQAIYNRPPVSQEQKEWANTYKEIRGENAKVRERKMEELAEQLHNNHQQASSKISVIGPHVEIYQVYHPKQTGPTKKQLEDAAIQIQKHMRGFVVRKKFEKLKRKAQWHGSTFRKMVRDYKGTLSRCQTRHGVEKPSTPFTFKDMNEYMDARRRYESVFDRKAFGGELELTDLEQFFRECDLYPSMSEIEEALDVVLHANRNSKRGLQKNDILECIFYIYVPRITGLTDTRQSTWMNPIIDGVEARKLLGSEIVEPAPLEVCAKLVIDSKRERRDKEKLEAEKLHKEQLAARKARRKARQLDPNGGDDMSDTSSNGDR